MSKQIDEEELLNTDPDYICSKRYEFSLKNLLEKNPNGVSDKVIAQALNMPVEDVQELLVSVINKLRGKQDLDK